ncbi:hypothetical protein [Novacetimonas pomaceti]|nr:hypothetical protein [Novacetimonas pomaceti]
MRGVLAARKKETFPANPCCAPGPGFGVCWLHWVALEPRSLWEDEIRTV